MLHADEQNSRMREERQKNFLPFFPEKKKQKKRKSDLANLGKQVLRCKDTLSKYLSLTCVMQICEKFIFYHLFHQMFDVYNMRYSYRFMPWVFSATSLSYVTFGPGYPGGPGSPATPLSP